MDHYKFFLHQSSSKHWIIIHPLNVPPGLSGGSVVKNLPADAGDVGLIPGWERSPGEGSGNPLQYSCLGNGQRKLVGTIHGVTKSQTRGRD